jgi:sulfate transport system ATP-binding protein
VRPGDLLLTHPGDGHPARVLAAHRRLDRTTLELQLEGQAQSVELDLAATSGPTVPSVGDDVCVKPSEYRVYPL